MADCVRPMEMDGIEGDFDDKENAYQNNVLPKIMKTEKCYEELDVSDVSMKLRYSITPTSSPVSKSFITTRSKSIINFSDDDLNATLANDNFNLTYSLDSVNCRNETEQFGSRNVTTSLLDKNHIPIVMNSSLPVTISENLVNNNVTITVSAKHDSDETISYPSASITRSGTPTPVSPTKEIPKSLGSPIMRGLKSMFSIFKPSQSPIPPFEADGIQEKVDIPYGANMVSPSNDEEDVSQPVFASTPVSYLKCNKEESTSKTNSPHKESIVFNEDLVNELKWNDESTIIFRNEKIPAHKLFFQPSRSSSSPDSSGMCFNIDDKITQNIQLHDQTKVLERTDNVKPVDISLNDQEPRSNTITQSDFIPPLYKKSIDNLTKENEEEAEFLDCETTFTPDSNDEIPLTIEPSKIKPIKLYKENFDDTVIVDSIQTEMTEGANNIVLKNNNNKIVKLKGNSIELEQKSVQEIVIQDRGIHTDNFHDKEYNSNMIQENELSNHNMLLNNLATHDFESRVDVIDHDGQLPYFNDNCNESDISNDVKCEMKDQVRIVSANHIGIRFDDINSEVGNTCQYTQIEPNLCNTIEQKCQTQNHQHVLDDKKFESIGATNQKNILSNCMQISAAINIQEEGDMLKLEPIQKNISEIAGNREINNVLIEPELINQNEDEEVVVGNHTNNVETFKQTTESTKEISTSEENLRVRELQSMPTCTSEMVSVTTASQYETLEIHATEEEILISENNSPFISLGADQENNINDHCNTGLEFGATTVILKTNDAISLLGTNTTKNVHEMEEHNNVTPTDKIFIDACVPFKQNPMTSSALASLIGTATEVVINIINTSIQALENVDIAKEKSVEEDCELDANADNKAFDNVNKKAIFHKFTFEQQLCKNKFETGLSNYDNEEIKDNAKTTYIALNNQTTEYERHEDKIVFDQMYKNNDFNNEIFVTQEDVISNKKNIVSDKINSNHIQDLKHETLLTYQDILPNDFEYDEPLIEKNKLNVISDEIEDTHILSRKRKIPETYEDKNCTALSENKSEAEPISCDVLEYHNPYLKEKTSLAYADDASLVLTHPTSLAESENKEVKVGFFERQGNDSHDFIQEVHETHKDNASIDIKNICSSGKVVNLSAGTTSEKIQSKATTVLDFDESSFYPFTTKSKIRQSPPPNVNMNNTHVKNNLQCLLNDTMLMQNNDLNKENSCNPEYIASVIIPNTGKPKTAFLQKICDENNIHDSIEEEKFNFNIDSSDSFKDSESNNITVKEVLTEDDDTVEGPFLETSNHFSKHVCSDTFTDLDQADKEEITEFVSEKNNFDQFAKQNEETEKNMETSEVFIDADAFEFFMNQNGNNVGNERGKESLFLKFDPLCANKTDASGVAAALSKVQKRISTPRRPKQESPGTSFNSTFICSSPVENTVDSNVALQKPVLAVTPAINNGLPVMLTNKFTTPTRSPKPTILTSPAIAVIDKLISMSSSNSPIEAITLATEFQQQSESESILAQLREVLSEKEENIQQLRIESVELKNRLTTLESQMNTLEKDNEEKLKKINDLNEKLADRTKMNKNMAAVVEEYERTIAGLIAESEREKKLHKKEREELIHDRDEQTAHLGSMEVSFNDLHSKYEKSKQVILCFKANEEKLRKSITGYEDNFKKMQTNYELLKQHATSKLNVANQEFEKLNRAHEAELLKFNAMIKRKELHITSLEETLSQKIKANEELTAICDELINKVG